LDTDANLNAADDVIFTESSPSPSAAGSTSENCAARVVVDRGSLKLLAGSKIDYVQEMIKSTFEVRDNPQSESACGCGSSFAIKNFASNPALD
jgi:iron-sulfur cluster assembly accessory protein